MIFVKNESHYPHLSVRACVFSHSVVSDPVTPWTAARQAPLSMRFSRQVCWSGLPFPPPGDLPGPGTELAPPALQEDSSPTEPPGKPHSGQSLCQILKAKHI